MWLGRGGRLLLLLLLLLLYRSLGICHQICAGRPYAIGPRRVQSAEQSSASGLSLRELQFIVTFSEVRRRSFRVCPGP